MIEKLIASIKSEQAKGASAALGRRLSDGKDASYEFGLASGIHMGLERALDLIKQSVADQKKDRFEDDL